MCAFAAPLPDLAVAVALLSEPELTFASLLLLIEFGDAFCGVCVVAFCALAVERPKASAAAAKVSVFRGLVLMERFFLF